MTRATALRIGILGAALAVVPAAAAIAIGDSADRTAETQATATAADPGASACAGVVIPDRVGDSKVGPFPELSSSSTGPAYMDITRVFITAGKLRPSNVVPLSATSRRVTANIEIADLRRDVAAALDGNPGSAVWFVVDFDDLVFPASGWEFWDLRVRIDSSGSVGYRVHARQKTAANQYSETYSGTTGEMVLGKSGIIQVDFPAVVGGYEPFAVLNGEITTQTKSLQNVHAYTQWSSIDDARIPDASTIPAGDWISDRAPDGGGAEAVDVDLQDCLRAAEHPDQVNQDSKDVGAGGASGGPISGGGSSATASQPPTAPPRIANGARPAKANIRTCIRRAKKVKNRKTRTRALRRCKRGRGRTSR